MFSANVQNLDATVTWDPGFFNSCFITFYNILHIIVTDCWHPQQIVMLEHYPLLAAYKSLFNIFTVTLLLRKPLALSAAEVYHATVTGPFKKKVNALSVTCQSS